MKIDNLNWDWALDTLYLLKDGVAGATLAHDKADTETAMIEGELPLRRSIRRSLISVQRNLSDAVVSIRGILSDQREIRALYDKQLADNPSDPSDIPF